MSILIKDIHLPQNDTYLDLVITADGKVCCYDHEGVCVAKAVELPDHGDLIDRDELMKHKGSAYDIDGHELYAVGTGTILRMPVVIPAERSDE